MSDEAEAGRLEVFVRQGSDELKRVTYQRSAGVTVTAEIGRVVAQREGNLNDIHSSKLQPGPYQVRVEGPVLRTIVKKSVFVVGRKATEWNTFVVAE